MPFENIDQATLRLHTHWLTAVSVKEALYAYRKAETPCEPDMPDELAQFGKAHSIFSVQKVFYALTYVVIEEYNSGDFQDETLDELLSDEKKCKRSEDFVMPFFTFKMK